VKKSIIAAMFLSATVLAQQPPMGQQQMPDLEGMFFQQFDKDQDGTVSKAEFLRPTEAQFDHMDRNDDGVIDRAEVQAFNEEMQQRLEEMQRQMQKHGGMPQQR
jgi:Ca2+-binding EF-hand superfamily protein